MPEQYAYQRRKKFCSNECKYAFGMSEEQKEKLRKPKTMTPKRIQQIEDMKSRVKKNPPNKGRKFSDEHKKKLSESHIGNSSKKGYRLTLKQKENISRGTKLGMKNAMEKKGEKWQPFFNTKACEWFEKFDKSHETTGQYATNGGERRVYKNGNKFLDYINDDLMIIIEWDEYYHKYKIEEDKKREQEIKFLFPKYSFIRIDESNIPSFTLTIPQLLSYHVE